MTLLMAVLKESAQTEPLATARGLGEEVHTQARVADGGGVFWIAPRILEPGTAPQSVRIGAHLYDGQAGVALFLAALSRIDQDDETRELSLRTLASLRGALRKIVADRERRRSLTTGIGGIFGIGSLIYSFVRIAALVDEPDLVQDAHELTRLLDEERFTEKRCPDLATGLAGTLLALLALHQVEPRANRTGRTPLDLAVECGRRLVERRDSFDGRPRAWVSITGQPPLSGFSHGAAGISYALARLHRVTGESIFLEAAREGLEYERTTFVPEQGNWLDMRTLTDRDPRCLNNWCHGAPGIALGRLGMVDLLDDPFLMEEIRIGLATTRAQPQTRLDHVCCGNVGRVEVMLEGWRVLGDEQHLEAAQELADSVVQRAHRRRRFGWQISDDTAFDPGFFTGAAGVGYSLLRLVEPTLPCILRME